MPADPSELHDRLSAWFDTLPEGTRQEYARRMITFVHDLRQPLAQIQSAEELLRRGLAREGTSDDLLELLDIVRDANQRASAEVAEFVEVFLEGLEPPDPLGK